MKKLFTLLTLLVAIVTGAQAQTVIYQSDMTYPPTGSTVSGKGTYDSNVPNWASAYSYRWVTGSSTNATTITFTTPIDLSGYTGKKLTFNWGWTSKDKTIKVFVNGQQKTAASEGSLTASTANTLYTTSIDLTETSITSITFQGQGSKGLNVFHFSITGTSAGPQDRILTY